MKLKKNCFILFVVMACFTYINIVFDINNNVIMKVINVIYPILVISFIVSIVILVFKFLYKKLNRNKIMPYLLNMTYLKDSRVFLFEFIFLILCVLAWFVFDTIGFSKFLRCVNYLLGLCIITIIATIVWKIVCFLDNDE